MTWETKKWTRNVKQYFTIKEADDTAKNISGYTIRVNANHKGTPLFSGTCTVASGTLGYCYYTILSGDFPIAGRAEYEMVLEKGTEVDPTETYSLQIGRRL